MSGESLINDFRFGKEDPIIEKIQLLSPKRLGIFTESFLKGIHGLFSTKEDCHDAVDASGKKIEMKASRVLIDHNDESGNDNLLEVLENDVRTIAFFEEAMEHDFACNIQQVKPGCFDQLNYLLLFKDCILEFNISSKLLLDTMENKKINQEVMKAVKKQRNKHPEVCRFLDEYLLDKQKLSDIARVCLNHYDKSAWRGINKAIIEKRSINFSAKQHRGNQGEGQFHIKRTNLQYHIDNFLVAVYTYEEFKNTLKECGN
jgi:hypothetical protein